MGGGDEREGGHDYFPAQAKRADGDFERDGAVARRNTVAHAEISGNPLLELLNQRAVVGQPGAIKHVADAGEELLLVAYVRAADVNGFFERRWCPIYGEVCTCPNFFHMLEVVIAGWFGARGVLMVWASVARPLGYGCVLLMPLMWDECSCLKSHDGELGNVSSNHGTGDAKGYDERGGCQQAYCDTGCINAVEGLLLILCRQ